MKFNFEYLYNKNKIYKYILFLENKNYNFKIE